MKNYLFLLSVMFFIGCNNSVKPTEDVINDDGIILKKSQELFLLQSEATVRNGSNLFWPSNLTEEFKKDSIRVHFKGTVEIDPPSPVPYTPLHLSEIEIHN